MPFEADQILQIPISLNTQQDRLVWHYTPKCTHTVGSGYHLAFEHKEFLIEGMEAENSSRATEFQWRRMWNLNIPPKMKNLVWRVYRGIIPVKERLRNKGMPIDAICCRCGDQVETRSTQLRMG